MPEIPIPALGGLKFSSAPVWEPCNTLGMPSVVGVERRCPMVGHSSSFSTGAYERDSG
jgi:hypothetical protein